MKTTIASHGARVDRSGSKVLELFLKNFDTAAGAGAEAPGRGTTNETMTGWSG